MQLQLDLEKLNKYSLNKLVCILYMVPVECTLSLNPLRVFIEAFFQQIVSSLWSQATKCSGLVNVIFNSDKQIQKLLLVLSTKTS